MGIEDKLLYVVFSESVSHISEPARSLRGALPTHRVGREADLLFPKLRRTLKSAPTMEVSQALDYLFSAHPPQDWSSLPGAIPSINPPFEGPIFMEGTLEAGASLGLALALGQGASTARWGMRIRRVGFLAEVDHTSLAGFPWEMEWRRRPVLKVAPFIERHNRRMVRERIAWAVPVGEGGEVVYPPGEGDPAAFALGRTRRGFRNARALGEIYTPLLCAALFSLFCLNAVGSGYASLQYFPGNEWRQGRRVLEIERLGEVLEQQGEVSDSGLSEALRAAAAGAF